MINKIYKHLLTGAFFAVAHTALSEPAYPVKKTIRLTDGREVTAVLRGDENLHFFSLENGQRALPAGNGVYKLATQEEVENLWTERMEAPSKRRLVRQQTARRVAYEGKKKGLVILVNFQGVSMTTSAPQSTFNKYFNQNGYTDNGMSGSVRDYFYDQSYGKLDIEFDVMGPVRMSKAMSYYGADSETRKDVNVQEMVVEACQAIDDKVDFSDYDWDGDGLVDQVFLVYAGYGQSHGADENTIWPHEHTVIGKNLFLDGVQIGTYACSCELLGTKGNELNGIGTACHEFSHCMGIMDFYDTKGDNFGMGSWDIMCSGNYNNNGRTPAGYTAYERWQCGWLEPVEINKATAVEGMKPLTQAPEAYILYNDYNRNEFYLLENRQQESWDASLAAHGLLVVHVDYDNYAWRTNSVNVDASRQRMTIIPADNSATDKTEGGDTYPGTTYKTQLTDTSSPAAKVYNLSPEGSDLMGKPIVEIQENRDGTISFAAMRDVLPMPLINKVSDITENSFNVTWNQVEGATGYTLSLREKPAPSNTPEEACVIHETFEKCYSKSAGLSNIANRLDNYLSITGWTGAYLYTSPSYLKMGQGNNQGVITTPLLPELLASDMTIVLTIKPYQSGSSVNGTITIETGEGAMTGSFNVSQQQVLLFTAAGVVGTYKISVKPNSPMYMSRLSIYDGAFTREQLGLDNETRSESRSVPMRRIASTRASENETFVTTTESNYTFADLTSTSTYYVKVQANTEAGDSKWSPEVEVKLDATAIEQIKSEKPFLQTPWYDMQGRQMSKPNENGVFIKDGKKILINSFGR